MTKKLSALGKLMDQLDISIQELAESLQIDKTTISKWRTGSRQLLPRSPYLDTIISVLLDKDDQVKTHPIRAYWSEAHSGTPFSSSGLRTYLKQLLTAQPEYEGAISGGFQPAQPALACAAIPEYTCLIGADGRKKAIDSLLTIAEEMTHPGKIQIMDISQLDWLSRDITYLKSMMFRLKQLVNKGFEIEIAFSTKRELPSFRAFILLLNEFRYRKTVTMYVVNTTRVNGLIPQLYAIRDVCVAVGLDSEEPSVPIHTNLYADFLNVHKYGLFYDRIVELFGFTPVITDDQASVYEVLRAINCMGVNKRDLYYFSDYLSIVTMSEDLLSELLNANAINGNARECCLYYYRTLRNCVLEMPQDYFAIFYWNVQAMEESVTQELLIEHELSAVINRPVYKTCAQYRQHLQDTRSFFMNHPHVRAVMRSGGARLPAFSWLKKELWCLSLNTHGSHEEYQVGFLHDTYLIQLTEEICEQSIKYDPITQNATQQCLLMLQSWSDDIS